MSKNYISSKTGHKPSDEFFKTLPVWFDSELLISFILGSTAGFFLGVVTILCI